MINERELRPRRSDSADAKRFSTAAARAALMGGSLVESTDDAGRRVYVLSRWAYTRSFRVLSEVERVLEVMGPGAS